MQIKQFARIAQNYAVRVSEFVRKAVSFFSRTLSSHAEAPSSNNRTCWKLPLAFSSSTLFDWKFGTTRSAIPSPFRSPLARFVGLSAAR